jgi:hypothetical protein
MMTQEEYVDEVLALVRQGKTIKEIGQELGYHPATVSKWLKAGGPPPSRAVEPDQRLIDKRWATRLRELVRPPGEKLLAISVHEIIKAEGFSGSYVTVARFLRDLTGPRFRAARRESPDRDSPGRGGPVRLVRPERLGRALGTRAGFLFWGHIVLELLEDVVVRPLARRRAHLRGPGEVLRGDRGRAQIGPHRPHGALGRSQGRRFSLHPPGISVARHPTWS